ncbi:endoplasmic reticulum protein [Cryptococcus neoformans Tu401-1]|nr:endoplasmic reticulum protein [Cryptococcus neoformans var. grubii Bt85]OXG15509.1 endoplasmic reticulum protein [Cryptococcus neoformans var. grubii Tu401-1]
MTLKSARPSLEVFYLKSTSTFFATDSSELPTAAEVAHDIVEEGVWAPMPFYLLGEMVTLAGMALLSSRFSRRKPDRKLSAATYLQDNANNVTAFRFVAQAPSTITNAVWYSMINLRPYDHPVAQAITLVGLMLMPIFSFIMTMTNNAVREVIAPLPHHSSLHHLSTCLPCLSLPSCLFLLLHGQLTLQSPLWGAFYLCRWFLSLVVLSFLGMAIMASLPSHQLPCSVPSLWFSSFCPLLS